MLLVNSAEFEYYIMLHSSAGDMYWRASDQEWVDDSEHATYFYLKWDVKAELRSVTSNHNPHGNHVSIQSNQLS